MAIAVSATVAAGAANRDNGRYVKPWAYSISRKICRVLCVFKDTIFYDQFFSDYNLITN